MTICAIEWIIGLLDLYCNIANMSTRRMAASIARKMRETSNLWRT